MKSLKMPLFVIDGPPEDSENPPQQDPLFRRGFVPNVTSQTELEQLHAVITVRCRDPDTFGSNVDSIWATVRFWRQGSYAPDG